MSTSYDAHLIYGFPFTHDELPMMPTPDDRDWYGSTKAKKPRRYDVHELAAELNAEQVEQHNAGLSNGGSPDYFIGVAVASVRDFTRGEAFKRIGDFTLRPEDAAAVARVAEKMGKDPADSAFYLIGDAA